MIKNTAKRFSHHRLDSSVFKAIQRAGVEAFSGPQDNIQKMNEIYTGRRDIIINGLNKLGWNLKPIKATFYIRIPTLRKSRNHRNTWNRLRRIRRRICRIALTVEEKRLEEAIGRMKKVGISQK